MLVALSLSLGCCDFSLVPISGHMQFCHPRNPSLGAKDSAKMQVHRQDTWCIHMPGQKCTLQSTLSSRFFLAEGVGLHLRGGSAPAGGLGEDDEDEEDEDFVASQVGSPKSSKSDSEDAEISSKGKGEQEAALNDDDTRSLEMSADDEDEDEDEDEGEEEFEQADGHTVASDEMSSSVEQARKQRSNKHRRKQKKRPQEEQLVELEAEVFVRALVHTHCDSSFAHDCQHSAHAVRHLERREQLCQCHTT